jgi:pyridoxal phosphate enzyme (YggS family)
MTDGTMPDIAANLASVRARITAATTAAGRQAASVALVAVSKSHGADAVGAAIAAGQRLFGENRVQEAAAKFRGFKAQHPEIELHLIGPLQTNKVKEAVALFDVIETVDRPKLAEALKREMAHQSKRIRLFVEVNTGEERQKAGVLPAEADAFIASCRSGGMVIDGLMCIPPADEEPGLHFALLREIARRQGIVNLSMGMSADYETAIRFGATHLRIGTAIFGARKPAPAAEA